MHGRIEFRQVVHRTPVTIDSEFKVVVRTVVVTVGGVEEIPSRVAWQFAWLVARMVWWI